MHISHILEFFGYDDWDKIKYIGLALTISQNKPSLWLEVISKIKAKIASWGGQWLTKEGKLIMIKSISSALPIYLSPLLLSPKAIMDHISKLSRDFLWRGGKGNQNRLHLVNWDIVKRPVLEGGLQIRDPSLTNLVMGEKMMWQLFSDRKHPVIQVLWKNISWEEL